jgi:hypothetical protein
MWKMGGKLIQSFVNLTPFPIYAESRLPLYLLRWFGLHDRMFFKPAVLQ